jgi:hypothetical protein
LEPGQLLALFGREPGALSLVDVLLVDPFAKRLAGDSEVAGEITDGLARASIEANSIGLELGPIGVPVWHPGSFL